MMFEFAVSYGLNYVLSNSYIKVLTCYMIVFGVRAFRRELRLNEIITVESQFNRIGGLIGERSSLSISLFFLSLHFPMRGYSERQQSVIPQESSHPEPNQLTP